MFVEKMTFIDGTVNAEKYQQILTNNLLLSVEELFLESSYTDKTTKMGLRIMIYEFLNGPQVVPN